MKKLISIILALFPLICGTLYTPCDDFLVLIREMPVNPFKMLWAATCKIESANNALAINAKEQAYGIAQIRQCKLTDYNLQTGSDYTLINCLDSALSRKIYMHFASKYNPHEIAVITKKWNGSGKMTEDYWDKVKKQLNHQSPTFHLFPDVGNMIVFHAPNNN